MKKLYGPRCLLVQQGSYIYNVETKPDIYYHEAHKRSFNMWMLKVHYDVGPNFCEGDRIRNKEIAGYTDRCALGIRKELILQNGIMDHGCPYTTPKNDKLWSYEYWVAPSQIIGFEIIEYEGEK